MTSRRLPHYLKSYRKRAGFSQSEMASLLGCESGAKVSRYERFARQPTLAAVLAYEAVFGVPAVELCPGLFARAQEAMARRAKTLAAKLEAGPQGPLTARKLQFLKGIAAKVEGISQPA